MLQNRYWYDNPAGPDIWAKYYIDLNNSKACAPGQVGSNSANAVAFHEKGEDSMANVEVGTSFSTGNSTVAQLPVGSILEVSADGELTVVELPEVEETHNPGDEFESKYGPAVVVKMTSQFTKVKSIVSGEVEGFLYVADGTNVVRGQLL